MTAPRLGPGPAHTERRDVTPAEGSLVPVEALPGVGRGARTREWEASAWPPGDRLRQGSRQGRLPRRGRDGRPTAASKSASPTPTSRTSSKTAPISICASTDPGVKNRCTTRPMRFARTPATRRSSKSRSPRTRWVGNCVLPPNRDAFAMRWPWARHAIRLRCNPTGGLFEAPSPSNAASSTA